MSGGPEQEKTAGSAPARALDHLLRPSRRAPEGALVLLHGRGADEADMLPLLDGLDPERRLAGVVVRAPLSLPPGGRHWYVLRELGHPDAPTFVASLAGLGELLESLPTLSGVPLSRTVVGGFSQGAVMSYAVALGEGRPQLAALLAFSGFVPEAEGFRLDPGAHRGLPVAIGHGIHDPVIPVRFGRHAAGRLEEAGLTVKYRESPMFHAIDPAFVGELSRWLPRVLEIEDAA